MLKKEIFVENLNVGYKSQRDKNIYKVLKLKNDIEVLLVQNNDFKNSSCVVGVNIGSYDDPEEYPGMAHFLEHMLFMGTERYPGENEFDSFLSEHNGSSNAFTANDKTIYYCNIDSSAFIKMVKMFASFFICPLFQQSSLENEMRAVDSEYLNTLNVQEWRIERLIGEINGNKKRGRFSCGNMETLQKEGIMEEMKKFWRNKYSSELMSVVLCSNESIEIMTKLTVEFEMILNLGNKKKNSLRQFLDDVFIGKNFLNLIIDLQDVSILDNNKLELLRENKIINEKFNQHIIWMNHISNKNDLTISIKLPSLLHLFKYKILEYIKYEIVNESKYSLLSNYKDNNLVFSIDFNIIHYVECSEILLTLSLTIKGCEEYKKVLDMLCGWLDVFVVRKCIWKWLKRIKIEEFQCQSGEKASEIGPQLCETLMTYPIGNLLNNEYLYEIYDEELITYFIKLIRDYTCWLIILSVNKNFEFDQIEKFYKIKYKIGNLYKKSFYKIKMQLCRCMRSKELSLLNNDMPCILNFDKFPCFNSFKIISDNKSFFLKDKNGKCQFVFEEKFKLPNVKCFFRFDSKSFKSKFVQYDVFLRLALDEFNEKYTEELQIHQITVLANMSICKGLIITIEGLSQHIPAIINSFFKILNSVNIRRFSVIKQLIKDDYNDNITLPPYKRLYSVLYQSIKFGSDKMNQYILDINNLIIDDIMPLCNCNLDMIVVGNINQNIVKNIYSMISHCSIINSSFNNSNIIHLNANKEYSFFTFDSCNNAIGLYFLFVSFDNNLFNLNFKNDLIKDKNIKIINNNEILNKIDDYNLKLYAIGVLFHQISWNDFYDQLRTKEQLGYIVRSCLYSIENSHFIGFEVQSIKSIDFLEQRIKKYVKDLFNYIIQMDLELFETHKQSVIDYLTEPVFNIEELFNIIFFYNSSFKNDLNARKRLIPIILKLKKEDLLQSSIFNYYFKVYSFKK